MLSHYFVKPKFIYQLAPVFVVHLHLVGSAFKGNLPQSILCIIPATQESGDICDISISKYAQSAWSPIPDKLRPVTLQTI